MVEKQEQAELSDVQAKIVALLHVLLKRKLFILIFTGVTALLSLGYSLTLPNIYAATAKVLPPQKESGGLSSVLGQMGGFAGFAAGAAKGGESDLYISLIKSRSVGAAVIERLDLSKRYKANSFNSAWKRLDASVKAQAGRDGIISITVEESDPKLAALLANTVADELGRTMVRLNLSKVGSEKLFLEKRLGLVKKDLSAAEDDLKAFSQRHKIAQVESQASASVSSAARLKAEIDTKEVQLAALRTSQSDESFEVKELQATIRKLRQALAGAAGNGDGGEGIPAIGNVPGLGLEYARKMRELKTQEALFEQLTKQYEMAKLNQAKDSSSLQILDEAVTPEEKVRPRRSTIVIFATLAALILSTAMALAMEYGERMSDEEKKALQQLKKVAFSIR